ncbi:YbaB/EbfC family nucleoid-associated protein [Nocardia callitridis]|uniref:YbaB/EbfC family DNA-binding protein n=1 Tax=Nocardia callitridis TaxID=648753 RepID=A0ABP9KXI9_9NOCA
MTNAHAKEEMAKLLDQARDQLRDIGRVQQERAQLTASATVRKKVTVTVNADGTVIETKFAAGYEELSASELAKAVTTAAQQAATDVADKARELMAPLSERRARLPKLSELIDGMPDFSSDIPTPPPVSLAPPNAKERRADVEDGATPRFSNVEVVDRERVGDGGVTDTSW